MLPQSVVRWEKTVKLGLDTQVQSSPSSDGFFLPPEPPSLHKERMSQQSGLDVLREGREKETPREGQRQSQEPAEWLPHNKTFLCYAA